ncbi:hypothetical protein [Furfurilactobacillus entadae]|uniref:hypothetical protein n=1 Tax=Furfurilactobacillus entadae TaxID=2922307 RepID=UPI0035EC87DF
MTNPRDLENHMVGDPIDPVRFGTDYKGDDVYCDQKVWMYGKELFADDDAEVWLQDHAMCKEPTATELVSELLDLYGGVELLGKLLSDDGFTDDTILDVIGATVVNEGDAA